ncbi:MAG TPA: METTL5 family protein [Candidatus Thermoplasmatota archaeon]|nr:METTL5 family protein [Candidatus Thermoplasmatota archaeon]
MRQRDLEILLERSVPAFLTPRPDLEQYRTPAKVAADWLYKAHALGDLAGKDVLDLGCGTGMLSVGAALLGARVTGVDVDTNALEAAREAAARAHVEIETISGDVAAVTLPEADTALTNPPFGAQRRGADRPFLEAAFRAAHVVHAMVNAPSVGFVEAFAAKRGAARTHVWRYAFAIPHQFWFHEKARQDVETFVVRFERSK